MNLMLLISALFFYYVAVVDLAIASFLLDSKKFQISSCEEYGCLESMLRNYLQAEENGS